MKWGLLISQGALGYRNKDWILGPSGLCFTLRIFSLSFLPQTSSASEQESQAPKTEVSPSVSVATGTEQQEVRPRRPVHHVREPLGLPRGHMMWLLPLVNSKASPPGPAACGKSSVLAPGPPSPSEFCWSISWMSKASPGISTTSELEMQNVNY